VCYLLSSFWKKKTLKSSSETIEIFQILGALLGKIIEEKFKLIFTNHIQECKG